MVWQKMLLEVRRIAVAQVMIICGLGLSSCAMPAGKTAPAVVAQTANDSEAPAVPDAPKNEGKGPVVDVGFLLTMTYDEAKSLSPANAEVLPNVSIAADEIKIKSRTDDGRARRASAKGHVFLNIDYGDKVTALAQEAFVGGNEAILRGKPLLKRGRTVVEGLEDTTVFFVMGQRLQVVGAHRITTSGKSVEVNPEWPRSWKDGPNPLLPALSPDDFPKELRASPLLPSLDEDDDPSKIPR